MPRSTRQSWPDPGPQGRGRGNRRQRRRHPNAYRPYDTREYRGGPSVPNYVLRRSETVGLTNNNLILVYPRNVGRNGVAYTAEVVDRRLGRMTYSTGIRQTAAYIRVRYCVSNIYENVFIQRCTELVGDGNRRVTRSQAREGTYKIIIYYLIYYFITNINDVHFVAEQEAAEACK